MFYPSVKKQHSAMFIRYIKSIAKNEQEKFRNKRGSDETHIVILLTKKWSSYTIHLLKAKYKNIEYRETMVIQK